MNTQDNQQQAPRLRITEREHMKGRDEHGHEIRWFSRYDELAVCHGVFVSIDGKEYEKADNETAQRMFLRLTVPQTKREALARITDLLINAFKKLKDGLDVEVVIHDEDDETSDTADTGNENNDSGE